MTLQQSGQGGDGLEGQPQTGGAKEAPRTPKAAEKTDSVGHTIHPKENTAAAAKIDANNPPIPEKEEPVRALEETLRGVPLPPMEPGVRSTPMEKASVEEPAVGAREEDTAVAEVVEPIGTSKSESVSTEDTSRTTVPDLQSSEPVHTNSQGSGPVNTGDSSSQAQQENVVIPSGEVKTSAEAQPQKAAINGQIAEDWARNFEKFNNQSPEEQAEALQGLEEARKEMEKRGMTPEGWEDVKNFLKILAPEVQEQVNGEGDGMTSKGSENQPSQPSPEGVESLEESVAPSVAEVEVGAQPLKTEELSVPTVEAPSISPEASRQYSEASEPGAPEPPRAFAKPPDTLQREFEDDHGAATSGGSQPPENGANSAIVPEAQQGMVPPPQEVMSGQSAQKQPESHTSPAQEPTTQTESAAEQRTEAFQSTTSEATGTPKKEGGAGVPPEGRQNAIPSAEQKQGITPPTAEQPPQSVQPTEAEEIEQQVDAALKANTEYQEAKQKLESDTYKDQQELDAMVKTQVPRVDRQRHNGETKEQYEQRVEQEEAQAAQAQAQRDSEQDEQDRKIEGMSHSERKEYEAYVQVREQVKQAEAAARYQVQRAHLEQQPDGADKIRVLEENYQKSLVEGQLAANTEYQANKRKYRRVERRLARTSLEGKDVKALAERKWDGKNGVAYDARLQVADQNREAIPVFANKSDFERYKTARAQMNEAEQQAKNVVFNERLKAKVAPDGRTVTEENLSEILEQAIAEKRVGAGPLRRNMRKIGQGIEQWFSKAEKDDHKRKMAGLYKSLIGTYGWRGLLAQWSLVDKNGKPLDDDARAQAKLHRKLFLQEARRYVGSSLRRLALFELMISIAVIFLTPVVMSKALDMIKPFGGK